MKIASWNFNSLNVCLPHLEHQLQGAAPDVIGHDVIEHRARALPTQSTQLDLR